MAVILWALGLCLLMQGYLCSPGQTSSGCLKWTQKGDHVCCDSCYPGNRLVRECGPNPKELCVPCEPNTYTIQPKEPRCNRCTQCVGAQVLVKECTPTTDTQCGCKEGLLCGDRSCSFCVEECKIGHEPTEKRSCRPCPNGTFSDQIHQKCKPWSSRCPNPDQKIVVQGNSVSDIVCGNVSVRPVSRPADHKEQAWPFVLSVITSIVLTTISIIIIVTVALKLRKKKTQTHEIKKEKKKSEVIETQIISTPTDDPRTLMAIECSFHEAQQEQGRSTESLASKESSVPLIV